MDQFEIVAPGDPQPPIESASASTACQTNSSRFAYALTAGVLGVASLLLIAICLLLFTAFATYSDSVDIEVYDMDLDDGWFDDDSFGPYRHEDWNHSLGTERQL